MSPGCEHNVAEENCDIVIIVIILICLEIVDTFSDARTIWCEGPGNTELVSEPQVSHHADQTGHIHHHYLSLSLLLTTRRLQRRVISSVKLGSSRPSAL